MPAGSIRKCFSPVSGEYYRKIEQGGYTVISICYKPI